MIAASSVGTLIEWYDFYIFGSLAATLAEQFFPKANPTAGLLSTLATFAAGFVVRPFGALVFGRLGDIVGRKYTFLVTLILMGGSTFLIGLVPGYQSIGIAAPAIVLLLRLVQGLALGGEYGGAATYVAEHAPAAQRGYYTSFIQTTATLGLFVSIGVILATRESMSTAEFNSWGWRVPFLLSSILVLISIYIRMRMKESPLFSKLKAEGKVAKNPIKESFGKAENLKWVLLALFGATAGQGVVWYTGQFYALSFIQQTCHIEFIQSYVIIAVALVAGTPLFIVFGKWSDTAGRKIIMMLGLLLAVVFYRPIYKQMYALADVREKVETGVPTVPPAMRELIGSDSVVTTRKIFHYNDGTERVESTTVSTNQEGVAITAVKQSVVLAATDQWLMIMLVLVQVVFVTMVYGPIAAFLVELFPTRIRYTSMSLPYHIGNGIFGGLTPFLATLLYESSKTPDNTQGDPFAGLFYPIVVAGATFVIGMIFLPNRRRGDIAD